VRTRDMGDSMLKPKPFTKPFVPQRDKDQKNPQGDWKGKPKLDDDTRRELMRNTTLRWNRAVRRRRRLSQRQTTT
jgi:hypothetical protein